MTQLTHKQQQLFNALSIVVGNAMYALTVVLFLMPSGLITGGRCSAPFLWRCGSGCWAILY